MSLLVHPFELGSLKVENGQHWPTGAGMRSGASQKGSGTTKALGPTSGNKMCQVGKYVIFSLLCIELYLSWSLKPG